MESESMSAVKRNGDPSLTDRVYAQLKDDILRAARPPESLLYENELAAEYAVSKTPIREALRLLVHEGLVVVLPRKGYLVRPLRFEDVRDVFALRLAIEPMLVAEAAHRATPDQLNELEAVVQQQAAATDAIDALEAGGQFHVLIARLSGNARALRLLESLVDETKRMHYLAPAPGERVRSVAEIDEHRALIRAMRDRDGDAARVIMERHSRESLNNKVNDLMTF